MHAPVKVCIFCGQDCSSRPRLKDGRGRYACKACAEANLKGAAPAGIEEGPAGPAGLGDGATSTPPRQVVHEVSDEPLHVGPPMPGEGVIEARPADEGPIPIAEEPETAVQGVARGCPGCRHTVPAGAVLCVHCGFDFRTGFKRGTGAGATSRDGGVLACATCGYDLTGLKSPRCPECGELLKGKGARRLRDMKAEKAALHKMYLTPGIMIGVGLLLLAGVVSANGLTSSLPAIAITLTCQIVVAYLAYLFCAFAWIGFDAPLHVQALRLAALSILFFPIFLLLRVAPWRSGRGYFIGPYGLLGALYVWTMAWLLDMDIEDAWMLGILTFAAQAVATLVLFGVFKI